MKICIVGLGYVGAVSSVCLADDGNEVFGVDVDSVKVELLRQGQSPVIEKDIQQITRRAVRSGNLKVATELTIESVEVDLVFVCVGTPSASNGSQDLTAIKRVCVQIGTLLRATDHKPGIVIRSTIPAGTTDGIISETLELASGKQSGFDFGLGFQPEFLREGTSVKDFYNPPFTVIGGDALVLEKTRKLFSNLPGKFIATDVASAEMLKVACNAFHALKVTFANEIGRLSQAIDLDSREVMNLVCMDTELNISKAYLKPGFAFGGSCLPKDLRALLHLAKAQDVSLPMLDSILPSNGLHINHVAKMVLNQKKRKVGFIGLSFKQGTDDLRESPLVELAETLIGKGYELKIFDEAVNVALLQGSNRRFIEETIPHFESLMESDIDIVLDHAEIVIVGHKTEHIASKMFRRADTITEIIDLVGLDGIADKLTYRGVCW